MYKTWRDPGVTPEIGVILGGGDARDRRDPGGKTRDRAPNSREQKLTILGRQQGPDADAYLKKTYKNNSQLLCRVGHTIFLG